ncbi:MAG TPA: DUF711 family protein [Anaerolineae bacterium]|nr:DUF711 family protein [Anaerolineae bacterium]
MNIRSITLFAEPPLEANNLAALKPIRSAFEVAGLPVQTLRLALPPFPTCVDSPSQALAFAHEVAAAAQANGIDYVSLGPATGEWIEIIPQLLNAADSIFCGISIASREPGIDIAAIHHAASAIRRVASLSPDGFSNLRLAALANVPPGAPFFPAAYHAGGASAFAIATESADLAVAACAAAHTAAEARNALTAAIEAHATQIATIAAEAARTHDLRFGGIDFSLAPFPSAQRSIGAAIERLSGSPVGSPASLAAAAVLTDAIDRARFPRCGFSGLMLPVLEDTVLAQRAAEGVLTLDDLLLLSAVCGVGLDTVPLPGDVSEAALAAILFDVAAQSLRLDKPLTARLMPIPDKHAGDPIAFDFPFFANSRVLAIVEPMGLGLIGASMRIDLGARRHAEKES